MEHVLVWIVAGVIAYFLSARLERRRARDRRVAELTAKYRDGGVAKALVEGRLWRGMSEEQLLDSWGMPATVDRATPETGAKTTYAYDRVGKDRLASRVMLEDGVVVGWEPT